jgi:preprotein translocase subunit SecY
MTSDIFAPLLRSQMSRRLLFTAGILLVYRLGCQIPLPGLNTETLDRLSHLLKTESVSVLAMGVTPFLSTLFIFEFVKLIIPPLARWETADVNNARRLGRYAYFAALLMAGFQARGLAHALDGVAGLLDGPGWEIPIIMTLVAGTALLGWLGDQITLRGVGNGFWLLLITPTLVSLPTIAYGSYVLFQRGAMSPPVLFAAAAFLTVAVALVAMLCRSGGAATEHRMSGADFAGVWPPLFATTISSFVVAYAPLQESGPAHLVLMAALIAAFNWLQSLGVASESSRPVWTTTLVQIFVCVGGELLTQQLSLPIAINGAWVIVVVITVMNCLRSKDLPAETKTT